MIDERPFEILVDSFGKILQRWPSVPWTYHDEDDQLVGYVQMREI